MSSPCVRITSRSACRYGFNRHILRCNSQNRLYTRPTFAPKPVLDVKHIRQNPGLYSQNCVDRNYTPYADNGWTILKLHNELQRRQRSVLELRTKANAVGKQLGILLSGGKGAKDDSREHVDALRAEAKELKQALAEFSPAEKDAEEAIEKLALELPNLSSLNTPVGTEATTIGHINGGKPPSDVNPTERSHVSIGKKLDILDFEASATTSGWGWYFLKNEAALLEQALIQYALSVAMERGWKVMTPPSLVYSHIADACGFMPRDQNGETQIYSIAQDSGKPGLVLTGTAEIPFAASQANKTLDAKDLPLKVIGPSRCYRAEAGARGVDTKGLYRVHEFTKVEMFAWTLPPTPPDGSDRFDVFGADQGTGHAEQVFDEMIAIQTEILTSLGLHARILEMPTTDLGASASRKIDIEAFFPSRTGIDQGYGEVTSASICTDYQTRRLATRLKGGGADKLGWPHTVNGTAMAIPRVLAAILENGWKENEGVVVVPKCLRKWMPDGMEVIGPK
jgi:seryl-tRNA synthetase